MDWCGCELVSIAECITSQLEGLGFRVFNAKCILSAHMWLSCAFLDVVV